jgi:T4 beta protein
MVSQWRNMAPWARPYVPIVGGRAGELDGLGWVSDADKDTVMPLVEILPGRVEDTVKRLARGWGGSHPVLLDTGWFDPSTEVDGRHHLVDLFDRCRGHVRAVPVGGLGRGIDHIAAIAGVVAADGHGAVLRLDESDLAEPAGRNRQIDGWLAVVDLTPPDVDVVVDVGRLSQPGHVAVLLNTHQLLATLPHAQEWRSLTLAGSAFPQLSPNGHVDSEELYERLEWRLWETVSHGELPRAPGFGDHVLSPPGPAEPPPGPAIIYTLACSWLVVKRRPLAPRFDELRAASQLLVTRPEFAGAGHCRGCAYIESCSEGDVSANWSDWRSAGACHHIHTSVDQVLSAA